MRQGRLAQLSQTPCILAQSPSPVSSSCKCLRSGLPVAHPADGAPLPLLPCLPLQLQVHQCDRCVGLLLQGEAGWAKKFSVGWLLQAMAAPQLAKPSLSPVLPFCEHHLTRPAMLLPHGPLLPQTRDYPPKVQAQGKVLWVCTQQARRRTIGELHGRRCCWYSVVLPFQPAYCCQSPRCYPVKSPLLLLGVCHEPCTASLRPLDMLRGQRSTPAGAHNRGTPATFCRRADCGLAICARVRVRG